MESNCRTAAEAPVTVSDRRRRRVPLEKWEQSGSVVGPVTPPGGRVATRRHLFTWRIITPCDSQTDRQRVVNIRWHLMLRTNCWSPELRTASNTTPGTAATVPQDLAYFFTPLAERNRSSDWPLRRLRLRKKYATLFCCGILETSSNGLTYWAIELRFTVSCPLSR